MRVRGVHSSGDSRIGGDAMNIEKEVMTIDALQALLRVYTEYGYVVFLNVLAAAISEVVKNENNK